MPTDRTPVQVDEDHPAVRLRLLASDLRALLETVDRTAELCDLEITTDRAGRHAARVLVRRSWFGLGQLAKTYADLQHANPYPDAD